MARRALPVLAFLAASLAAAPASADDALIDVGAVQGWLRISPLGQTTVPTTGIAARWMWVDGHGEVALGGRITAWKPMWGKETDSLGFDLEFNAMFGGRFKGRKAHIMPCGGFAVGLRNMLLSPVDASRHAVSGIGLTLHLGAHGYFGRDSGFYWRLAGFGSAHLLFPDPGWSAGGGVELMLGIYID
jgi:hypothetical protein